MRSMASIKRDRKMIFELMDMSWKIAEKKGMHPLERGCNCIICVNKRKRIVNNGKNIWKHEI